MGLKIRVGLLLCLLSAAILSSMEAYRILQPTTKSLLPEEIYAEYAAKSDKAQFFLKDCDGYVAIYKERRDNSPMTVTAIEVSCLRGADRAMIEAGIPVSDRKELLLLLEDLGS